MLSDAVSKLLYCYKTVLKLQVMAWSCAVVHVQGENPEWSGHYSFKGLIKGSTPSLGMYIMVAKG